MIVDSHCHASLVWFEPIEPLMGRTDKRYQHDCMRKYPHGFASVVVVDHTRDGTTYELERWIDAGASGVRLPPGARSPGDDPLAALQLCRQYLAGGSAEDQALIFGDTAAALFPIRGQRHA